MAVGRAGGVVESVPTYVGADQYQGRVSARYFPPEKGSGVFSFATESKTLEDCAYTIGSDDPELIYDTYPMNY